MENEIKRLKRNLERAYAEVSKLKVSGDVVDVIAEVREELRQAMRMAVRIEEETASPPAPAEEREVTEDAAAENEV